MTTTNWKSCLVLLSAGTLALTGCSSSGSDGKDGEPGGGGTNPPGVTKGINVAVTGVTSSAAGIAVRFTLADDKGFPLDLDGIYSVNTAIQPRFSLSYLTEDTDGNQLPLTVLTASSRGSSPTAFSPTAYNPFASTPQGTIVENEPGDYTYTFPPADITATDGAVTKGVAYDGARRSNTHVVWIQATRQTDLDNPNDILTFTAKNEAYYYVPAGGTPQTREIVLTSNCSKCHADFKPESLDPTTDNVIFHSGGRVEAPYCEVCHNPARTSNPAADSMVFVHRIHASEELRRQTDGTATAGVQLGGNDDGTDKTCSASKPCTCAEAQPCVPNAFHGIADVTYPHDIRNCNGCHGGAPQGDQWKTRPSRAACGSCHDTIDWATGDNHPGGIQTSDAGCNASDCHHTPDDIAAFHLPVAPPAPDNAYGGGANNNTNAAYIAAANAVPPGATVITYDVKQVLLDGSRHPQIVFKLKRTDAGVTTDVVFNTCLDPATPNAAQELMTGFVGGPSVYFVFALPQDGIEAPADFNASASGYIRNICNGTVAAATATITGPDTEGYYTVTLTGTTLPTAAKMLTGGVGYSYSLSSTQPLTQIDLPDYPYGANKVGGLIVPAPNIFKVATGFTGRRTIVDNAKCNACHVFMGANPTFHAGQRNDGPSCAWCHTPNRASSGWSANSKDIIHDIHAARKRVVEFSWHAAATTITTGTVTSGRQGNNLCTIAEPCTCEVANPCYDDIENFADVTFPSRLNNCEACHVPGTYDFTLNASAVPNLLWSTEAARATSEPAPYAKSPYLGSITLASLGAGYATSGTGCTLAAPCEAAGTTIVTSPIMAACVQCHDKPEVRAHMINTGGGSFYEARSTALAKPPEQCLICHGHGTIADISEVHLGK